MIRHRASAITSDAQVVESLESRLMPPVEALLPAQHPAGRMLDAEISPRGVKDLVRVFKLLSDGTRLRILLYLIQRGELNVRDLCERLAQSQPAVSHHLALMRMAGLVDCRRAGKHNFYRVLPERFQRLLDLIFENTPPAERQIRFQDYVLSQLTAEV